MKLYRIYCGLDTNNKEDQYGKVCFYNGRRQSAKELALILAAECFPNGHTVYEANGRWMGEVGVINESTIIVEFMAGEQQILDGSAHKAVARFAGLYKVNAYQESVLVTDTEVNAAFV